MAGGVAGGAFAVVALLGAAYYLSEPPPQRNPDLGVRPNAGEAKARRPARKPPPEPRKRPPKLPERAPTPGPPTDPPDTPLPPPPPVVKEPAREEPGSKSPPKIVEVPLVEDLPADLEKKVLAAVNSQRSLLTLPLVVLDARRSKACRDHARYLARNAGNPIAGLSGRHDEELSLPGATEAGRAAARTAHVVDRDPLTAVTAWAAAPAHRALMTEPRLCHLAFGFARNADKQWVSVFDWQPPAPAGASGPGKVPAVLYPLAGQQEVPVAFPGNEVPDPVPLAKDKRGGYPITVTFPARARVLKAQAWLEDEAGNALSVWFSSPEEPANPRYPGHQGNNVCLIAREVLRPGTRYAVLVKARVERRPWARAWAFVTASPAGLDRETHSALARINSYRKAAGLRPVALDPDESRACSAHARYLARNLPDRPRLNVREEKSDLPGYTPEGGRVAARALISPGTSNRGADAVDQQMDFPINRSLLLNPGLEEVGLGHAMMPGGGFAWVMEVDHTFRRVPGAPVVLFPGRGQKDVPLRCPRELRVPGSAKDAERGYAVSVTPPAGSRFTKASARLEDAGGKEVECWVSTPDKPLGPHFHPAAMTLVPRAPLRPATAYAVRVTAQFDGKPWKEAWSFTTVDPARAESEVAAAVLGRLNEVRKAAGFGPVRLDDRLSRGCSLHARYLARNHGKPALEGLGIHDEDPRLPGPTPEGKRAGKASVIASCNNPRAALDSWLDTFYHRIPLLAPELRRVGYGQAQLPTRNWIVVLDVKSGK